VNPDSHDLNGFKDSTTPCATQDILSLNKRLDKSRSNEEKREAHVGKKIMISGMKTKSIAS
jgi:hypothetical protein